MLHGGIQSLGQGRKGASGNGFIVCAQHPSVDPAGADHWWHGGRSRWAWNASGLATRQEQNSGGQ